LSTHQTVTLFWIGIVTVLVSVALYQYSSDAASRLKYSMRMLWAMIGLAVIGVGFTALVQGESVLRELALQGRWRMIVPIYSGLAASGGVAIVAYVQSKKS
jgi:hypothetical protein